MSESSQRIGRWVMTSIGDMFPAITHNLHSQYRKIRVSISNVFVRKKKLERKQTDPLWPLLILLTTSFTPLFKHLCSAAETTQYIYLTNTKQQIKKKHRQIERMRMDHKANLYEQVLGFACKASSQQEV